MPLSPFFQDRSVKRGEKKKSGGLFGGMDGEDAKAAAESTRAVAALMEEAAASGDSLDFLGEMTDSVS